MCLNIVTIQFDDVSLGIRLNSEEDLNVNHGMNYVHTIREIVFMNLGTIKWANKELNNGTKVHEMVGPVVLRNHTHIRCPDNC